MRPERPAPADAGAPRFERELIFCLQAVQLGLLESKTLVDAGLAWSRGEANSLRDEVLRRVNVPKDQLSLVDQTVDLILKAHKGDPRASLESLGGNRKVLESFGGSLVLTPTPVVSLGSERPSSTPGSSDPAAQPVTQEAPGRYTIKSEQGRGGIGRVLVAFDEHVGRDIAIKELLTGGEGAGTPNTPAGRTTGASARFLREARLTGQLEHPGIVPVYEVGQRTDGTLYYAMRLVRGRTLEEAIEKAHGLNERISLLPHVADLASAIAYAHSRGVLHRDIKPQNVMIGEFGETVVLDWGLARIKGSQREDRRFAHQMELLKQAAAGKTLDGEALGTPEYMPPEQAWGELDRVDEHSDVYSLGAVLYELLTGKPPFEGVVAFETIGKVQRYAEGKERLVPIREREREAPPELAAVAEKALAARPEDRYPTAKALLEDLNRFMSGRRVGAYDYSSLELLKRFWRKNRTVSSLAVLLVLVLIGGAIGMARAWQRAEVARAQAEDSERQVHRHLASGYAEKAARLVEERDWLGAKIFAAAALRESPFNPLGPYAADAEALASDEAREQIASLQSSLYAASANALVEHEGLLARSEGTVQAVAFSPDGSLLAMTGFDGKVRIWGAADRRELAVFSGHEMGAGCLAWSPDGKRLATGSWDKTIRIWSIGERRELGVLRGHGQGIARLAFSPDGALLASAGRDKTVRLWDAKELRELGTLAYDAREGSVDDVAFSPDGTLLAGAGPEKSVTLWSVAERRPVRELAGHSGNVLGVFFGQTADELASLGADQTLKAWSTKTGEETRSLSLGELKPRSGNLRFDVHGAAWAALATHEGALLWDLRSGQVTMVRGHEGALTSVSLSSDGERLATAGLDRRVNLWKIRRTRTSEQLPLGHEAPMIGAAIGDRGRLLVTASRSELRVFDLAERRRVSSIDAQVTMSSLAVARNGRLAATASREEKVALWTLPGLGAAGTLGEESKASAGVAVSPDGAQVATSNREGAVRLWDARTGQLAGEVVQHEGLASSLRFSPDGLRLASAGMDKTVRIVELATRKDVTIRVPERARVLGFSPDGRLLATGDAAWTLTLWDTGTGKAERVLGGHRDVPRAVAFSPDGKLLATAGGTDRTVRLWESASGRLVQVFPMQDEARAAVFGPDGQTLLAAAGGGVTAFPLSLDLWRQEPVKLLREAEDEASMVLEGFELEPAD